MADWPSPKSENIFLSTSTAALSPSIKIKTKIRYARLHPNLPRKISSLNVQRIITPQKKNKRYIIPCPFLSLSQFHLPFVSSFLSALSVSGTQRKLILWNRLEICRDRRDRQSCKIFVSCVNFPENNAVSYNFCKFTHT